MGIYIAVSGFILFDVLTGLLKALYHGGINSTKLRLGLYHKAGEVLAVVGSALLEYALAYIQIGVDLPVIDVVSVYICVTELVSILENLAEVNPALARLFKPYLAKLNEVQPKDSEDKEDE